MGKGVWPAWGGVQKTFFHNSQKSWFTQIIIYIILRKSKKIKDLGAAGYAVKCIDGGGFVKLEGGFI